MSIINNIKRNILNSKLVKTEMEIERLKSVNEILHKEITNEMVGEGKMLKVIDLGLIRKQNEDLISTLMNRKNSLICQM